MQQLVPGCVQVAKMHKRFAHGLQDCVNKTIARIKSKLEKEDKRVLSHVVYGLRSTRK